MEHLKKNVRIVPMAHEHLDEVAALERACFSTPWSRNMLASELENDAAAYLVADVWRVRRGMGLFILFGRASLVAYMIGEFFWPCFMFTGNYVTKGLTHLVGAPMQGVFACIAAIALLVGCLWARRGLAQKCK